MRELGLDQDAVAAGVELVRRAGAKEFEVGYLHDDVPTEEAGWYAHASFKGARITFEAAGPVEAIEGLARRLLSGALCRRCGKTIRLADDLPGCRWTRNGKTWTPGCGLPIDYSIPAAPQ